MKFKAICITFAGLLLIKCGAPGFEIINIDDKLSDPPQTYMIVGKNNRLSLKSTQGGTHVGSKGVYLDPYVIKAQSSGKVLEVGFYITHHNYELAGGFRSIREIIFITNMNERIVSNISGQESDYDASTWNAGGAEYKASFSEYGISRLNVSNFIKILTTKSLEVKIIGGSREQTYSNDEISPSFKAHLMEFYNTQVK